MKFIMPDINKQWMAARAYEELQKIAPHHGLLKLVNFNGNGIFEPTNEFNNKYVWEDDRGEFRGYARYAAALRGAVEIERRRASQ